MNLVLSLPKYEGISIHDPTCYPLGFMYISSVLKKAGHKVKILNYNLCDYDFREEVKGADAVLMTGFEHFLPTIIEQSAICKEVGIKTVVGGALATFRPFKMLKYADSVVFGEGEDLIEGALAGTGIFTGDPPDLHELPLPDYEGFGIDEYHKRHSVRYMGVLTSRGCPWNCKFCAHTCRFQMRPLSDVLSEIQLYIDKYKIQTVIFNDNTLNLNKNRFIALCEGMKRLKIPWGTAIRAWPLDREMMRTAKESGLQYVIIGVESFRQDKLDEMNKQIRVKSIVKALDLLHEFKIGYHGNILFGFPGETYEDILKELSEIPKGYNVFPAMIEPFIGTSYTTRSITQEQYVELDTKFRQHMVDMGKVSFREDTLLIDVVILTIPSTDKARLKRCLYSLRNEDCPVYVIDGVVGCIGAGRVKSLETGDNPYVSFVDPDDEVIPGIYTKIETELMIAGKPSIIYHNEIIVDSTNNTVHHGWSYDKTTIQNVPEHLRPLLWDHQNQRYFHHRGAFKREDAIPHCRVLKTLHMVCEPQLMQLIASESRRVQYLNEWGYIWNIHGKNMTVQWLRENESVNSP